MSCISSTYNSVGKHQDLVRKLHGTGRYLICEEMSGANLPNLERLCNFIVILTYSEEIIFI